MDTAPRPTSQNSQPELAKVTFRLWVQHALGGVHIIGYAFTVDYMPSRVMPRSFQLYVNNCISASVVMGGGLAMFCSVQFSHSFTSLSGDWSELPELFVLAFNCFAFIVYMLARVYLVVECFFYLSFMLQLASPSYQIGLHMLLILPKHYS
jgi:hypothetical protein